MSPREFSAYNAGLRHAAHLALVSALALELRFDAAHTRQQAAIAALRGLAEGLKEEASAAAAPQALTPASGGRT